MLLNALLQPALGLSLLAAPQSDSYGPPPGMVKIPEKVIEVGADPEELEELIKKNERVRSNLAAELGNKRVRVEAYYLMPYEVTNEQYLRFVLATGHRPPQHWGQAAIDQAARDYLEATFDDDEAPTFSPREWWAANWRDVEWSMPTDIATYPVVYVDFDDVTAYCRWAGLRLMTEFEFQAAGRDQDRQRYTWGNEWDRDKAVTSDPDQRAEPLPVGSIEGAKSEHGIYDLCGNVWEWTSSPYVELPGYRELDYTVERGKSKRRETAAAVFDSSKRVSVGGSFANGGVAARLSTRRPTPRDDSKSALGFRCAADLRVGSGRAAAVAATMPFDQSAFVNKRAEGLDPSGVLGFERWIVGEGRLEREDYAVIDGHEWLVWIPARRIDESSESGLATVSKEGPVPMGVLSTTVPLAHPQLEPGTYVVAWRTDGEPKRRERPEDAEEKDSGDGPELPPVGGALVRSPQDDDEEYDPFGGLVDYDEPAWIFYDATMKPVASLVARQPESDREDDDHPAGTIAVLAAADVDPEDEDDPRRKSLVPTTLDAVRVQGFVGGSRSGRGFTFVLDLGVEIGAIDRTWRR